MENFSLEGIKGFLNNILEMGLYTLCADFEIVNTDFELITYKGPSNQICAGKTLYDHVYQTGQKCIIDSPRRHNVCLNCPDRNRCLIKMEMAFPILMEDRIVGIMGVFSYSITQRAAILKDFDNALSYIDILVGLIENDLYKSAKADKLEKDLESARNNYSAYGSYQKDNLTEPPNIIGNSDEAERIRSLVRKISKTDSTVFISGPEGCGKELAARRIHFEGERKDKPFVKIDCKCISYPDLYRGIFGMGEEVRGNLSFADPGVVYIKNTELMPEYIFKDLANVIINRKVHMPNGETSNINIKFIFSSTRGETHKKLALLSGNEINFIPLKIAPLSRRVTDLTELIPYFVSVLRYQYGYNNQNGIDSICEDDDIMNVLKNHSWPGNVRELQFVCKEMLEAFMNNIEVNENFVKNLLISNESISLIGSSGLKTLRELENEYIDMAIMKYGNTTFGKKNAAKELGIGIATLYRRLGEKSVEGEE
ncbi:MAG: sigma 54-interacting transcriptional regulator [Clostridiales bacterium]|jgi:DNA-binding NtrC family response regulator|nr:sigma 54-interacting transcriptional regulator [Clostridiales bacterium]